MIDTINIKRQIDISLLAFLQKVKGEYKLRLVHPILFKSIKDFTLRKGKRIRPLFLILSYLGYAKKGSRPPHNLYYASTCMELLHNFMLIHDDIIDRSDLRRGRPTMHRLLERAIKTRHREKLGYDLSIIAGDILYALAIDAFLSIDENPQRKEKALKYFIKTAAFTAMGEFIDILHGVEKIERITERDVFLNYTLKTARYTFECPLVIGAILAGAKQSDIRPLAQLGTAIGQAFQIQDDILGIFGSQKAIGKSILSDIAEFKKTILTCHAYRQLSSVQRKNFIRCFSKDKKSYRDLVTLRKIFITAGSLRYSLHKIKLLVEKAHAILNGLNMHDTYRRLIWGTIETLFKTGNEIAKLNGVKEEDYG